MLNGHDLERARDALYSIPADIPHDEWVKVGMGFHAVGGPFEDFDAWSSQAHSYNAQSCRAAWRSFKIKPGGIGGGTLFAIAREQSWKEKNQTYRPTPKHSTKPLQAAAKPQPGMSAAEVWERCEPATNQHPYVVQKSAASVSLNDLRVVPADYSLHIMGETMVGALVVPCISTDGTLSTLQFITVGEVAEQLKAKIGTNKVNLPSHSVEGWFLMGSKVLGGRINICEGIGQAWACIQASEGAAVCCFGWGNVRKVAKALKAQDPNAKLVIVPDVGKEDDAHKIATDVSGTVATMPDGWEQNCDVNDLIQRDGLEVLALLLDAATEPPKPEARYKLLNRDDLAALPPLAWRVRGVLPTVGLAGLYGPSASGKSFLGFDLAAAIAGGCSWFDCRVIAAPVVYAALEGEAGFKLRAQAWEVHNGRILPDDLHMMMQPFKLTSIQDVKDFAAVIPAGAVVFLDTLNRAAPTADENSSKDMGEILEAAKSLQVMTGGLVVLVHHTGKDASKGLRGHSSLYAALDAAIAVSRDGDRRTWTTDETQGGKSKDGAGVTHAFRLEVELLGTDAYGDSITSCTVRINGSADDVKRVKLPQGGNQRLVYDCIRSLFKDGVYGKLGAPPLSKCIELEAAVGFGASRLTCETHRRTTRAREAIAGLVTRGVLGLNEGWLWTAV